MSEQTYTTRTEPEEPFTVEAMEKAIQSLREQFPEQFPEQEFWHSCHCPWFEPPFRLDLPIEQPSITAKWTAAGLYKEQAK